MRSLWIATAAIAAVSAPAAQAQAVARSVSGPGATFSSAAAGNAMAHAQSAPPMRPSMPAGGWQGPRPMPNGGWQGPRPMPNGGWQGRPGGWGRWGQPVNGRWSGGWNAPGGWNAYRRPTRGWVLPSYWFAPSFYIQDYADYGLGAPPYGYNWSRYYDDAVLIDGRGRVYDSVGGLDWDGYDRGYAYDDGDAYYADGRDDDYRPRGRRDDGVGGAVIGGVVGGVAGNVIAGHGNRLAGTLIGAGVGAVAGAAIDRAEDRDRYGRRLPPVAPDRGPPPYAYGAPGYGYSYDGRAYTQTWYAGGGSYAAGSTIVTVQPTVTTTTTTTTEYVVEDRARVVRKRVYRKAPVRSKILYRDCRCTYTK